LLHVCGANPEFQRAPRSWAEIVYPWAPELGNAWNPRGRTPALEGRKRVGRLGDYVESSFAAHDRRQVGAVEAVAADRVEEFRRRVGGAASPENGGQRERLFPGFPESIE
jgi:hypothetical protein